ncbi:MAG: hypothetical protein K2H57_10660 [Duncaniella sp.]|nr:hypothetical protein [Duncaniella sp.]
MISSDTTKKNYGKLSFNKAMTLLPKSFMPLKEPYYLKRYLCAKTPEGNLAFCSSSKEYPEERKWRAKPYCKEFAPDIDYWIVALDFRGILVLSSDMIDSFCQSNVVELNPSGMKWKLAFMESDGRIIMTTMELNGPMIDVTDLFIVNRNNYSRNK